MRPSIFNIEKMVKYNELQLLKELDSNKKEFYRIIREIKELNISFFKNYGNRDTIIDDPEKSRQYIKDIKDILSNMEAISEELKLRSTFCVMEYEEKVDKVKKKSLSDHDYETYKRQFVTYKNGFDSENMIRKRNLINSNIQSNFYENIVSGYNSNKILPLSKDFNEKLITHHPIYGMRNSNNKERFNSDPILNIKCIRNSFVHSISLKEDQNNINDLLFMLSFEPKVLFNTKLTYLEHNYEKYSYKNLFNNMVIENSKNLLENSGKEVAFKYISKLATNSEESHREFIEYLNKKLENNIKTIENSIEQFYLTNVLFTMVINKANSGKYQLKPAAYIKKFEVDKEYIFNMNSFINFIVNECGTKLKKIDISRALEGNIHRPVNKKVSLKETLFINKEMLDNTIKANLKSLAENLKESNIIDESIMFG